MARVIIIPARLASDRLPEKLVLADTGSPLIQHTYERCRAVPGVTRVVVAADGARIAEAVRGFGGEVVLTDPDLPTGTDRVAAAARALGLDPDADLIVNVQGDEPEIDPGAVDQLFGLLESPLEHSGKSAMVATLATPRFDREGFLNPNRVKVVTDRHGFALYFSRSGIPFPRRKGVPWGPSGQSDPASVDSHVDPWLCHVGTYGFHPGALDVFSEADPSPLESHERLEQLRFLEMGVGIRVAEVGSAAEGIDTPEDYRRFVERHRNSA